MEEAIKFLKEKGILKGDCTELVIKFLDGKSFDLASLLDEFKNKKA